MPTPPVVDTGLRLRRAPPSRRQRLDGGSQLALFLFFLICLAAAAAGAITHPFV
jgi:hypothetical protein